MHKMESGANDIFYRYAPYLQEYIYQNGWAELRGVQLAAARTLFNTDHNLLLTSGTASGKTEAAFFPILSLLDEMPSQSVAVLYIAPLKSLINDQFFRMQQVLELSGLPLTHWHGDVAASHKAKLMKNPSGILQITPESLESMLMNRSNDMVRMFYDLRFVVIDEIHILMGTDRGNQILCLLTRLARLIGHHPIRVGLSATVGEIDVARAWLGAGSGRETDAPVVKDARTSWRLAMEHFFIQADTPEAAASGEEDAAPVREPDQVAADGRKGQDETDSSDLPRKDGAASAGGESAWPSPIDPGYEYMYDCVKDKKSLVFSNSREETEYITATLRQIAERRGEPDIFLIHHGNLSAPIREEAEKRMKEEEGRLVTCATVTMELGIDIGRLERVVQVDAPHTVSGFLQRLGRSGRRGAPPEMIMVFREENPAPDTPLPQLIPWSLVRATAIVQLYLEERFIEPPSIKKMPLSLMFHQTLSVLAGTGEMETRALAERLLAMPPFQGVDREIYRELLLSMLNNDFLEMTEEKTIIVGLKGERLINNYRFYAVFKDQDVEFSVRCESDEIGTITSPPPVGDRFALAGRVWEVTELDVARKLVYVKGVRGKMEVSWPGDYGEIHTRILERMRQVLCEDTLYPYLKPMAAQRLSLARKVFRNAGAHKRSLIPMGGMTWCMFPWLGTRSFRTLRKYLKKNAARLGISQIEYEGCCYMTMKLDYADDAALLSELCRMIQEEGIDRLSLVSGAEMPVFEKFDPYIPGKLLRQAYAVDRLRTDEIEARLPQMLRESRAYHSR